MTYDPPRYWYRPTDMKSRSQAVTEIAAMFAAYGHESYGEGCTQLMHAQQCGTLALERGLDEELALAAFLHDIGHFIARDRALDAVDAYGYANHSALGAEFLAAHGFSDRIVEVIREHVRAKRYLCATSAGYLDKLSHASRITLGQQGGVMAQAEVDAYRLHPRLTDIVRLRELDDAGKRPEMNCPPLEYWLALADKVLTEGWGRRDRDIEK